MVMSSTSILESHLWGHAHQEGYFYPRGSPSYEAQGRRRTSSRSTQGFEEGIDHYDVMLTGGNTSMKSTLFTSTLAAALTANILWTG